MNNLICPYGRDNARLMVAFESNQWVCSETAERLAALVEAGEANGFKPRVVSAYRSLETQSAIVQAKWYGRRAVIDDYDQPVMRKNDLQWLKAILRFSALPGASRHHWGTDVDIIDQRALDQGHQLQLVPSEYAQSGIMGEFACWLTNAAGDYDFGFPYAEDAGWVSPEPWHISDVYNANKMAAKWCHDEWSQILVDLLPTDLLNQISNEQIKGFVEASMYKLEGVL